MCSCRVAGGGRKGESKEKKRRITALHGEMLSEFCFGTIHLTSICCVSIVFYVGTIFSK